MVNVRWTLPRLSFQLGGAEADDRWALLRWQVQSCWWRLLIYANTLIHAHMAVRSGCGDQDEAPEGITAGQHLATCSSSVCQCHGFAMSVWTFWRDDSWVKAAVLSQSCLLLSFNMVHRKRWLSILNVCLRCHTYGGQGRTAVKVLDQLFWRPEKWKAHKTSLASF